MFGSVYYSHQLTYLRIENDSVSNEANLYGLWKGYFL